MDSSPSSDSTLIEIKDLLLRLTSLRQRFRMNLPESLTVLKERLSQTRRSNPIESSFNFDQFYTVASVFAHQPEPMTMGELGRSLDVRLSTATRIVDWLVSNGYACRLADPGDRRIVRVKMTEAGSLMYSEIDAYFRERISDMLHSFSTQERCSFLELLEKMVSNMEKESIFRR